MIIDLFSENKEDSKALRYGQGIGEATISTSVSVNTSFHLYKETDTLPEVEDGSLHGAQRPPTSTRTEPEPRWTG